MVYGGPAGVKVGLLFGTLIYINMAGGTVADPP
jgi:hypothetical protein